MTYPVIITGQVDPVPVTGTVVERSSVVTQTAPAVSAVAVVLKASNDNRRGLCIANRSAIATLFVKFSPIAAPPTITSYNYALPPSVNGVPSVLEIPFGYTGEVCGIWDQADAAGAALVGEFI